MFRSSVLTAAIGNGRRKLFGRAKAGQSRVSFRCIAHSSRANARYKLWTVRTLPLTLPCASARCDHFWNRFRCARSRRVALRARLTQMRLFRQPPRTGMEVQTSCAIVHHKHVTAQRARQAACNLARFAPCKQKAASTQDTCGAQLQNANCSAPHNHTPPPDRMHWRDYDPSSKVSTRSGTSSSLSSSSFVPPPPPRPCFSCTFRAS